MKKLWAFVSVLLILNAPLWGQTPSAPSASPSNQKNEDSDEKPFKPHWENEFGLSASNQQAGQSTSSLSYTGSYHFNESGSFLSGELALSQQKVEGVVSKTGNLTVTGGLGLGSFSPSLAVGFQGGESALKVFSGDLSLGIQLWDPFAISLSIGGNTGSHEGDISAFYPALTGQVQIDTSSWNSSLGANFTPWDWWTLSLTVQNEYDLTYQLQATIRKVTFKIPVNQTDHITSLTLGLDFTLFKGFVLGFAPQVGQEYFPAGLVYSPNAGGLVNSATASTQNFGAGTLSITYTFE